MELSLCIYCSGSPEWCSVEVEGGNSPPPRYGHSMVVWTNKVPDLTTNLHSSRSISSNVPFNPFLSSNVQIQPNWAVKLQVMDTLGPAFIGRLSCPLFGGRTFTRKVNVCGVKVCPLLIGCFSIMSWISFYQKFYCRRVLLICSCSCLEDKTATLYTMMSGALNSLCPSTSRQ